MTNILNERNKGLDVLKLICSFLVVLLHLPVNFQFSGYITAISRIAVPIFFMITGYFYKNSVSNKKQIRKVAVLLLFSSVLYSVFDILPVLIKGESLFLYLSNTFSLNNITDFLLFNKAFFAEHLWYLWALLYVLAIVQLMNDCCIKVLYCIVPLLLFADLLFGLYSDVVFGIVYEYFVVRNFACVGLPYFAIGHFIKNKEKSLKNSISGNKSVNLFVIIILIVLNVAEYSMIGKLNVVHKREHYITTTLLAVSVFIFCLNWNAKSKIAEKMAVMGRKYSAIIYIIHPIIISVMFVFTKKFGVYGLYSKVQPIAVFLLALAFATICARIIKQVNKKKE